MDAGKACAAYHDKHIRNVKASRIQVDEIWNFTYAKQKNVASSKDAPEGAGDTWTRVALDPDSKLIVSYLVGGRDAECAMWFMDDLAARLANRAQLTSDGDRAYLEGAEGTFGCDVDYARLVKMYGATVGPAGRYSPAKKIRREGDPGIGHVSTSDVERPNVIMRMQMRCFTRLTNASSKKVENHAYAVALHMMYYNFVRIHKTLRMTPAMAAGVTDRLWEVADIAQLVENAETARKKRGFYKKAG